MGLKMKASLLTIGTEITTGEILNTNVHWLSERLEGFGIDVIHHLTVPDQKKLIKEALDYISTSEILVVTGGLGPTRDDLTREAVAEWLNQPLKPNKEAWEFLLKWMEERGRTPRESHQRQCQFPPLAQLLKNTVGTALGFSLQTDRHRLFVLPGPPKELKPMWLNEVEPQLPKGGLTPWVKWVIEGLPESEVAERFEKVLSEFVDPQQVEIGYRASPPRIHVKIREISVPPGFIDRIKEEFGLKSSS